MDTGRQLVSPVKLVPPAQSWFLLLMSVEAFLDLPLSRREPQKRQDWARQQTSFMRRQKEKLMEEV